MGNTKIGWTDMVWNPIRGCSRVSSGCGDSTGGGCYAERMAHRFSRPGGAYEGLTRLTSKGPRWTGKVRLVPELLDWPLRKRKPRKIFVNSMSDLFHAAVPDEFIVAVFDSMRRSSHHIFQLLTKRPERMRDFCRSHGCKDMPWVRLGVSVEDQASADERIPLLLDTPSTLRFLSVEPLLAPVDLQISAFNGADSISSLEGISWVIIGCESGPYRRFQGSSYRAAARDIIHQCQMANVPVFHKQMSINGKVSADLSDWPSDLQIREFPRGD